MAGGEITVGVGVKGVADPPCVAGAEDPGDFTVGGDVAGRNLTDEGINLVEKGHGVSIVAYIKY